MSFAWAMSYSGYSLRSREHSVRVLTRVTSSSSRASYEDSAVYVSSRTFRTSFWRSLCSRERACSCAGRIPQFSRVAAFSSLRQRHCQAASSQVTLVSVTESKAVTNTLLSRLATDQLALTTPWPKRGDACNPYS